MTGIKFTLHATPVSAALFLCRVAAMVLIGLSSPWYVTVLAAVLQLRFSSLEDRKV